MQPKQQGVVTIGLFGTCGGSKWRDRFLEAGKTLNAAMFNPQVDNWDESMAQIEAEHLVEDEIILFPVTDETYAEGSLAETGFSVLQAIKSNDHRFVVVYVSPTVNEALGVASPAQAKASRRARALVLAHLNKQKDRIPNLFLVDSMDAMFDVCFKVYNAMLEIQRARKMCK
jgi:hypothetical protein